MSSVTSRKLDSRHHTRSSISSPTPSQHHLPHLTPTREKRQTTIECVNENPHRFNIIRHRPRRTIRSLTTRNRRTISPQMLKVILRIRDTIQRKLPIINAIHITSPYKQIVSLRQTSNVNVLNSSRQNLPIKHPIHTSTRDNTLLQVPTQAQPRQLTISKQPTLDESKI